MVKPVAGLPKIRTYATVVGMRTRFKLGVHNNSLTNVLRGLTERVYRVEGPDGSLVPPPAPQEGIFSRLGKFRDLVIGRVGRSNPWTYAEFLSSCRGSRRTLYAKAIESLQARPLDHRDAELLSFVKAEKLDLEAKSDPAPRMIQPRSPRYNAWVGRYLKAIEHRIYQAIDEVWGRPTVMSGYNALDVARHMRGHWEQWTDTVAIGLDASRFDQHVSVEALEWEHGVYNAIYRDARLAQVLKWQINNRGLARTAEGTVKYKVDGKRMSGDMNTSLGNKLIMCALVWQYVRERGLTASLVNNGDDCVVFLRKGSVQAFSTGLSEWFLRYGFTMKVEAPVSVFERIEFCQHRPVYDGQVWLMTRSPVKGLAKDFTMIGVNPRNVTGDFARWAVGVGTAGVAAYGGIPVVQEAYSRLTGFGLTGAVIDQHSGLGAAARGMKRHYSTPGPECRASYFLAWGVTPALQVVVERQIRAASMRQGAPYLIDQVDHLSIAGL